MIHLPANGDGASHAGAEPGPSPHYVLAHYALRQVALDNPMSFLSRCASPEAGEFIDLIVDMVCDRLQRQPDCDRGAIKIHCVPMIAFPCAIIEMPPPAEIAQAHFIALVLSFDLTRPMPKSPEEVEARYVV